MLKIKLVQTHPFACELIIQPNKFDAFIQNQIGKDVPLPSTDSWYFLYNTGN